MMDETLQLLRYACKLEVISRRDMERMLQALGTPGPEELPPSRQLVQQGLISEQTLAELWGDERLGQSLGDGVIDPDEMETLRALREIHDHPELRYELLDEGADDLAPMADDDLGDEATMVAEGDELAPMSDDDFGEEATMVADGDELAPMRDDDFGEEATMVFDEPPAPPASAAQQDLDDEATIAFGDDEELPALDDTDDEVGECPTMIADVGELAPVDPELASEAETMIQDPSEEAELEAMAEPGSTEAETIIQQGPPRTLEEAAGVVDPDDEATMIAGSEEVAASAADAQVVVNLEGTGEMPPLNAEAEREARTISRASESDAMEFEPDPSISQYKTRENLQQAAPPPPAAGARAGTAPDPVTAAPFVPPRQSRLPLVLLLIIAVLLGARVAMLEVARKKGPDERTEPTPPKKNGKQVGPSNGAGVDEAEIILREAERILPPTLTGKDNPREIVYHLTLRWFQRGKERVKDPKATHQRLARHLIMRWGEYMDGLSSLAEADAEAPATLWARAFAYQRLVKQADRAALIEKLAALPETDAYGQMARAARHARAGKLGKAREIHDQLDSDDPLVQMERARWLRLLGRRAAAAKQLKALLTSQPAFLAAQIENSYDMSPDKALGALGVIARKLRHDPYLTLALAAARRRANELPASRQTLEDLLLEHEKMAEAHLEMARLLKAEGKPAEAKKAAAKAVTLHPGLKWAAKEAGF